MYNTARESRKVKCLVCGINEATQDKQLGVLPCPECQSKHKGFKKPNNQIEFTSDNIKEERKKHFKSTLQKYRDGQLSKEFIQAYPERAKDMIKEGIHTEKEIKNSKRVWDDISPAGGIERTK